MFFLWHAPPSAMRTTRPRSNRPMMPPDAGPLLPLFMPLDLLHDAMTSSLLDMTVRRGKDLVVYFDGQSKTLTSMTKSRKLRMRVVRREGMTVVCASTRCSQAPEIPNFSKEPGQGSLLAGRLCRCRRRGRRGSGGRGRGEVCVCLGLWLRGGLL